MNGMIKGVIVFSIILISIISLLWYSSSNYEIAKCDVYSEPYKEYCVCAVKEDSIFIKDCKQTNVKEEQK